jgi:hypothetical protein
MLIGGRREYNQGPNQLPWFFYAQSQVHGILVFIETLNRKLI